MKRKRDIGYNIAWEVTDGCNHNCFFCYNYGVVNKNLSDENVDYNRICNYITELKPVSVALTGGEPLLIFDKIKPCIEVFSANGMFIRLLTNGSLLDESKASFLKEHNVQLMVSFPAANSEVFEKITGNSTYNNVVQALDILKSFNADATVNIVVNALNVTHMEETAQFLLNRYDFKTLYFSRATKPQNAKKDICNWLMDNEMLQEFFNNCINIKHKYNVDVRTCGGYAYCAIKNKEAIGIFAKGCGGGSGGSFVISNSGDVRICGKDSEIYGNVFETSIDNIVKKAEVWQTDKAIPSECRNCSYKKMCRGGCHMSSYDEKPSYSSIDANACPEEMNFRIRHKKNNMKIALFTQYELNNNVHRHAFGKKIRYSYKFGYAFVPKGIDEIFIKEESICLFKIMWHYGFLTIGARKLMQELIAKEIIVPK